MKTNKVKLSIPKPCHEDWNKMTPQEKGNFCGSCAKVVVDFTKMSDREVIAYLQKKKEQKTCGRFNTFQVGRELLASKPAPSFYNQVKNMIRGVILSLGLSGTLRAETPTQAKLAHSITISDQDQHDMLTLKGQVLTINKEAIPYATIEVFIDGKAVNVPVDTNSEGKFEVFVETPKQYHRIEMRVTKEGFLDKTIAYNLEVDLLIYLEEEAPIHMLGDVQLVEDQEVYSPQVIEGVVSNQDGEPLPFAEVFIKGTKIGTTSDVDGKYKLVIPIELRDSEFLEIQAANIGMQNQSISISINQDQEIIKQDFTLWHRVEILMGMIMVDPFPKTKPSDLD